MRYERGGDVSEKTYTPETLRALAFVDADGYAARIGKADIDAHADAWETQHLTNMAYLEAADETIKELRAQLEAFAPDEDVALARALFEASPDVAQVGEFTATVENVLVVHNKSTAYDEEEWSRLMDIELRFYGLRPDTRLSFRYIPAASLVAEDK
jgi:hypothetical protein